eukprot:464402_1
MLASRLSMGTAVATRRMFSSGKRPGPSVSQNTLAHKNRRVALYALSAAIGVTGVSYAAVPLYKAFCQATGYGGTTQVAEESKAANINPVVGRHIRVRFNADVSDVLPWTFRQAQNEIVVMPGETALAFFTAKNNSDKDITGVATYNVFPLKVRLAVVLSTFIMFGLGCSFPHSLSTLYGFSLSKQAGIYFNKIQCFCFEEQRLKAGEEVDMPVFFFVDPEIMDDPKMDNVKDITLHYSFFKTGDIDISEYESQ